MEKEERIANVREAIALSGQAVELLDEAVEGSGHYNHYDAYGKYGIEDLLGNGNRFNTSLFDLIDMLNEDEE